MQVQRFAFTHTKSFYVQLAHKIKASEREGKKQTNKKKLHLMQMYEQLNNYKRSVYFVQVRAQRLV